jgi:hypothetical protein
MLKVNSNQTHIFKLSSKHLFCLPKAWLNHLIDFTLIINESRVGINSSLFSCVCDKFCELNRIGKELAISISDEYLNRFISFFDLMKGYSFSFEDVKFPSFKFLFDYFE